jgi:hypothetical protein
MTAIAIAPHSSTAAVPNAHRPIVSFLGFHAPNGSETVVEKCRSPGPNPTQLKTAAMAMTIPRPRMDCTRWNAGGAFCGSSPFGPNAAGCRVGEQGHAGKQKHQTDSQGDPSGRSWRRLHRRQMESAEDRHRGDSDAEQPE